MNAIKSIPFREYQALDRVNWSSLKHLAKSPAHYLSEKTRKPPTDTDDFRLGRATHTAILEPEKFTADFVTWDGARRAGKEWEAFNLAHVGRTILTMPQTLMASLMQRAVRSNRAAMRYLEAGQAEVTALWQHETKWCETGADSLAWFSAKVACKGRLDFIGSSAPAIVDLKTTRDASPEGFSSASWRLMYHAQAAFYVDGLKAVTGVAMPFVIVAVEKVEPYVVQVYRLPEELLEQGRETYRALLDRLRVCQRDKAWPGYSEDEVDLIPPRWARPVEDEDVGDLDLVVGAD